MNDSIKSQLFNEEDDTAFVVTFIPNGDAVTVVSNSLKQIPDSSNILAKKLKSQNNVIILSLGQLSHLQ